MPMTTTLSTRPQCLSMILCISVLFFPLASKLYAATPLIDTGPVSGQEAGTSVFHNDNEEFQSIAYKITLLEEVTLDAISIWLKICQPGYVVIKLFANDGSRDNFTGQNTPGTLVASKRMQSELVYPEQWYTFSGLNWQVTANDYWISVEPEQGFRSSLPGSAAHPLNGYALTNNFNVGAWHIDDSFTGGFKLFAKNERQGAPLAGVQLLLL